MKSSFHIITVPIQGPLFFFCMSIKQSKRKSSVCHYLHTSCFVFLLYNFIFMQVYTGFITKYQNKQKINAIFRNPVEQTKDITQRWLKKKNPRLPQQQNQEIYKMPEVYHYKIHNQPEKAKLKKEKREGTVTWRRG